MPAPSKFAQALTSDTFLVTCELDAPHGTDPALVDAKLAHIGDKVQALVIADNPRARLSMSPLGLCRYLLDKGFEPVMTVTCRDRNRLALQSDLLAAAGLGIRNILAVTGDYITWGDHPGSAPVFDLDSVQLLRTLSLFNAGQDLAGQTIEGPLPDFNYGAAFTLTANPLLPQVLKFNKKVRCQPNFFMSHPLFDLAGVEDFFKEAGEVKTPLLASVCLLTEEQVREYGPGRYPGLIIPAPVLEKMRSWAVEEFPSRMVEFTAGLIAAIKKDKRFRGVHLMLQGREEKIGELV
jgi:methylenetetrahydrofolate reductase (NADPH)